MIIDAQKLEEGLVLCFDKPLYWTSFDLVKKVKYSISHHFGLKKLKVGHAGTLDPLATGLLVICTGRATKTISQIQDKEKEYIAVVRVGETTPSYDLETEINETFPWEHIDESAVNEAINSFLGEQSQVPPVYSAKLVEGKRAYTLARKGIERKMDPVMVNYYEIELMKLNLPDIELRIKCSKGTYIRSFAYDFGKALNSGGHLQKLRRTAIGEYSVEQAITPENFTELLATLKQI